MSPPTPRAVATIRLLPRVALMAPRALRIPPRWRLRLLGVALLAIALGAAYLFWFRDSSFVRVEQVTITGLNNSEAKRVHDALTLAARQQTSLHVDEDALRAAVADEPIVRDLRAIPDFPHGLRIEVVENRPVAELSAGGETVAVAPDGTVLEGARAETGLPTLKVNVLPTGRRLGEGVTRQLVAVAGAAPAGLLPRITDISIRRGPGVVVQLRHGPELYFGRAADLTEKWAAAASVLASRSSQGATYIDVRMFTRPVAGGLPVDEQAQPEADTQAAGTVPGAPAPIPAEPPAPAEPQVQAAPADPSAAATAPPAAAPGTSATPATPPAPTATNPQP
jgi:hypothetical protein